MKISSSNAFCFPIYLLHVLSNTVLAQELFRLHLVVHLGRTDKRLLKEITINLQSGLLRVVLIQSQGDYRQKYEVRLSIRKFLILRADPNGIILTERCDDIAQKASLNRLSVTLALNQLKNGGHNVALYMAEQAVLPADQGKLHKK